MYRRLENELRFAKKKQHFSSGEGLDRSSLFYYDKQIIKKIYLNIKVDYHYEYIQRITNISFKCGG